VNLDFVKAPKAFALKIAVNAAGEIGGLFFIQAQSEAASASSTPPYVHAAAFTAREVKIGPANAPLGGTVTIPTGKGPFPGVVLVHGSGPNDRDENADANHPFKDIAEGLSSDGIVVLRYDKRTRVYQMWPKDITVDTEVIDDAVAAVGVLSHQPEVDPARVFILGHSLGAMLAPEIAARSKADGVIMLAPEGLPALDELARQARYLGAPADKVAQLEEDARLLKSRAVPPDRTVPGLSMPAAYFYDLAAHNEIAFAQKLGEPILILRGTRDYQVINEDIEVWRKGLKTTRNVTIETIPNLNHRFIAGSGPPGPDEYMVPGYVAPVVIAKISAFILRK
jgi:dienelactone hydrolase